VGFWIAGGPPTNLDVVDEHGPMMPISVYTFHSFGSVMHVVHHAIDHGSEML
jgi:hypothetical protein